MPFFARCGPLKTKTKKWSLLTGALRAFVNKPLIYIYKQRPNLRIHEVLPHGALILQLTFFIFFY